MILVIDVGNTRLKWAWLENGVLSAQEAVVHKDAKFDSCVNCLFDSTKSPSRVLVSNVAGGAIHKTLQRESKRAFHVEPEFITPTKNFHELTNGYLNPSLLGADRWLAVIGAWTIARGALCVVDVGTAVKIDSVNAHGQHLGGLIAPGIHMMRDVLMKQTANVASANANSTPSMAGFLANNTTSAMSRGAVFAIAGMADRAAEIIEQNTSEHPRLFITGGDADQIIGTMRTAGEVIPDLVLRGLAVIAAATA